MTGYYAKDISDTACGAVWHCINNYQGDHRYFYDDQIIIKGKNEEIKINKSLMKKIKEMGYDI